jgi:hypothetical protein
VVPHRGELRHRELCYQHLRAKQGEERTGVIGRSGIPKHGHAIVLMPSQRGGSTSATRTIVYVPMPIGTLWFIDGAYDSIGRMTTPWTDPIGLLDRPSVRPSAGSLA